MDNKLLPCPFCGAEARILNYSGAFRVIDTNYMCGVPLAERWYKSEQEAISAWNSRSPDIVYCKDCKYGVPNAFQCGLDYCSFGERRKPEDEKR
jgi:hypothetical protein